MKTQLTKTWYWLCAVTLTVFAGWTSAQERQTKEACVLYLSGVMVARPNPSPYGGPDTRGEPVIFGKEFQVPELHMRFVDAATGKPVIPKVVDVHYYWLWLEWPYPEHDWGAWSDAEDWVKCATGSDQLVVPTHRVKPRGWYNGKYTKFPYTLSGSKEPKFDRLEIVFETENCAPRLIVPARDIRRFKDRTAVVKLPCAGWAEVEFERPPDLTQPKSGG